MLHSNAPAGGDTLRIFGEILSLWRLEGLSYQVLEPARLYLHSAGHNTGV